MGEITRERTRDQFGRFGREAKRRKRAGKQKNKRAKRGESKEEHHSSQMIVKSLELLFLLFHENEYILDVLLDSDASLEKDITGGNSKIPSITKVEEMEEDQMSEKETKNMAREKMWEEWKKDSNEKLEQGGYFSMNDFLWQEDVLSKIKEEYDSERTT